MFFLSYIRKEKCCPAPASTTSLSRKGYPTWMNWSALVKSFNTNIGKQKGKHFWLHFLNIQNKLYFSIFINLLGYLS